MMDNFPHWVDHILALLLCAGIPLQGALQHRKGFSGILLSSEQKKRIYISGSFSLFVMGAVVMLVWLFFKRPLPDIGLTQPSNFSSWWWLVIVFALLYLADTVITLSTKNELDKATEEFKKRTPFLPTKKSEIPEYLLLCFSAGVFEEIVYRGYLVNYCWYLFEGYNYQQMLSVFLPAFVFSISHFYQGIKAVIKIFVLAVLFGYLFIFSGSLLIVMIIHFLVDAAGGFLTMKYMKEQEPPFIEPDPSIEDHLPEERIE